MFEKEQKTKICKSCRSEIDKKAKRCPHCGAKQGMPIWLIVIIVILFCGIISSGSSENTTETGNNKVNKEVKVTVADFSSMTKADIDSWAKNNKINYSLKEDYSDTVEKGKLISQSVNANQTIYEGEKIDIVMSLGKKPTMGQTNALAKAKSYSSTMHMSKQGIYNQLISSIEGFTVEEAQYAIDNVEADWKANALAKAKSYSLTMHMSKQGIYNQLTSSIEGFTVEEAQYAIDNLE